MRWCDRNSVFYIIGLASSAVLERLSQQWTDQSVLDAVSADRSEAVSIWRVYICGRDLGLSV